MKTKSVTQALTVLFIFTLMISLSAFKKNDTKDLTGKWKEISMKDYCTEKGIKATGKQFLQQAPGVQILEIKADHTFTSTELMNWVPSELNLKGTWTLTADQLNTKLDAVQPDPKNNPTKEAATNIYTMSISGNNLTLSLPVTGNPMVNKMEKTYVRM